MIADFIRMPQPLIIFIEEEEDRYDAELFKLAKDNKVTFRAVSTLETALEA